MYTLSKLRIKFGRSSRSSTTYDQLLCTHNVILIQRAHRLSNEEHQLKLNDAISLTVYSSLAGYASPYRDAAKLENFLRLPKAELRQQIRALSDQDAQRFLELGDWVRPHRL